MKRSNLQNLPDAINCSVIKDFTQVPNDLLKNPNITGKAKSILCILLSNKKGWTSYITTLSKMMKEGIDAIRSGVIELEEHGYLLRIRYRNKKTKQWVGSFWAYADIPYNFKLKNTLKWIENNGLEYVINKTEKPHMENPIVGKQHVENPMVIIYNNNNTNKKDINKDISIQDEKPIDSNKKHYLSISKKLAKIISTHKKINCNQNINSWVKPIKLLMTKDLKINGTEFSQIKKRILKALKYYENHIGEKYTPVIQSGDSFRKKFIKLEDAMKREFNNYEPKKSGTMMQEKELKIINKKTIIED